MKTRFTVEKHEEESGATDAITVAKRTNSPHFQSFANEHRSLPKTCQGERMNPIPAADSLLQRIQKIDKQT